jgi:hypothetical protein
MPSVESYWILFATDDQNQNCHTGDPVEHAGLSFHKIVCSVMYPKRCFRQCVVIVMVRGAVVYR